MADIYNSIKEQIVEELTYGSMTYFCTGLQSFHEERNQGYGNIQSSIGNLAISIELMIKAYLASISLLLLFKDIPIELKAAFSSPEKMPDTFPWRMYKVEIRKNKWKTHELNACIALFYTYFPEHKQALKPFFRVLSESRNASIHFWFISQKCG